MKPVLATIALMLTGVAHAATPAVETPIRAFVDAFNKGDIAAAGATHDAGATIIDEVPPYMWSGPKAFTTWVGDLMAWDKAHGISGEQVAIKPATRTLVEGDRAYVVVPATYSFTQNGVTMTEAAQFTYAMKRSGKAWKIAGWSWTGPNPREVK